MGRLTAFFKLKYNKFKNNKQDPNEVLDYAYQKQLEAMQNIKRGIAELVGSKKRLEIQLNKLKEQIINLQNQAQTAVKEDKEDLARLVIERKLLLTHEAKVLESQIDELSKTQEQLINKEQNLRYKIESFKAKKEILKAQYSAASAQVQLSGAIDVKDKENIALALEKFYDQTEDMKARAAAVTELEETGFFDDVFDRDINLADNKGNNLIEKELKELKDKN